MIHHRKGKIEEVYYFSCVAYLMIFFRVDLPLRQNGKKCELQGIFVGAKVVRGFDWEWGNQDGGEGN